MAFDQNTHKLPPAAELRKAVDDILSQPVPDIVLSAVPPPPRAVALAGDGSPAPSAAKTRRAPVKQQPAKPEHPPGELTLMDEKIELKLMEAISAAQYRGARGARREGEISLQQLRTSMEPQWHENAQDCINLCNDVIQRQENHSQDLSTELRDYFSHLFGPSRSEQHKISKATPSRSRAPRGQSETLQEEAQLAVREHDTLIAVRGPQEGEATRFQVLCEALAIANSLSNSHEGDPLCSTIFPSSLLMLQKTGAFIARERLTQTYAALNEATEQLHQEPATNERSERIAAVREGTEIMQQIAAAHRYPELKTPNRVAIAGGQSALVAARRAADHPELTPQPGQGQTGDRGPG